MPMDSRSRTTKCLRLVSHPCFETIISQNEDTHLTKQPPPKTQKHVAEFGLVSFCKNNLSGSSLW